jgi:hypothetical protein
VSAAGPFWEPSGYEVVIEGLPEGDPPDLATGIYRMEFCGSGQEPGDFRPVMTFRFLGADDPDDETPHWRRPGVRYLTSREQSQIRQLYALRDEAGKRRYTQAQLADRFGTTATTISRLTRPAEHVPVPRKRRTTINHDHDQETAR